MPQTNVSRRHSQNVNTDRVEYHYMEKPSTTDIDNAATGYTFIPASESITLISTQPKIIKVTGYHYRLLGTVEPTGQTWNSSNTFTALYINNAYISPYETASASTPAFLKIGIATKGFKYYEKVNETAYYELIGKMPNELESGEVGIGRSANNEVMYIKNSDGQMVEFRSYKANVDYVDNEITDVYNLIYSIHYSPSWTVSPSVIFKATDTSVTATAKLSFNGSAMSDFNASTPSGWTVGTTSGTSRTFTKTINSTSNVSVATTITKDAYSKAMSATITVVNHIFYGASSDSSLNISTFANSGLTGYTTAVTSAVNRSYTVTMGTNQYFYIAVPAAFSNQPSQVGVGGASGFFEALEFVRTKDVTDNITGITESYRFYRTQSTQTSGSHPYYVK